MSRDPHERDRNYVFVLYSRGRVVNPALIDRDQLGESALPSFDALAGDPHPLAPLKFFHLRTCRKDRARQVATDNVRKMQLCRNQARTDVQIDGIDIDGGNFKQALIWSGLRIGKLVVKNDFRWPGFFDERGFHELTFACT